MADIFANAHRANARAATKKQEEDAKAAAKQVTAKGMQDNMKPVFNDLPAYKPKWAFRLDGPK